MWLLKDFHSKIVLNKVQGKKLKGCTSTYMLGSFHNIMFCRQWYCFYKTLDIQRFWYQNYRHNHKKNLMCLTHFSLNILKCYNNLSPLLILEADFFLTNRTRYLCLSTISKFGYLKWTLLTLKYQFDWLYKHAYTSFCPRHCQHGLKNKSK